MQSIDLKAIQGWHPKLRPEGLPVPLLATYESGEKRLQFLAATHTKKEWREDGPPLVVETNPTLPHIAEIMRETPPKFVILEVPSSVGSLAGQKPFSSIPNVITSMLRGEEHHDGEPGYAAAMCQLKNIPYTGAEPSDAELMPLLEAQGFNSNDLQGLWVLRSITHDKKVPVSPEELRPIVELSLKYHADKDPQRKGMDYEAFTQWFDKHKPADTITFEDTIPLNTEGSNHFQKFAHAFGLARDQFLYQAIDKAMNEHGDVLVIYGEGHYFCGAKALSQSMGEPEIKTAVAQDIGFDLPPLFKNGKGPQQGGPQPKIQKT